MKNLINRFRQKFKTVLILCLKMTHSSYLGHNNNFLPKIGSAILSVYCNLTQKKKRNQPIRNMLQKNKWTVRAEFIGVSGRVV